MQLLMPAILSLAYLWMSRNALTWRTGVLIQGESECFGADCNRELGTILVLGLPSSSSGLPMSAWKISKRKSANPEDGRPTE
jgi:hypothetical protein